MEQTFVGGILDFEKEGS